jgi:hypothetical protein
LQRLVRLTGQKPNQCRGWQCLEVPGIQPHWTGENAKQSAIDYAKSWAKFGHGEIRVLNPAGSVDRIIPFDEIGSRCEVVSIISAPLYATR